MGHPYLFSPAYPCVGLERHCSLCTAWMLTSESYPRNQHHSQHCFHPTSWTESYRSNHESNPTSSESYRLNHESVQQTWHNPAMSRQKRDSPWEEEGEQQQLLRY